MSICPLLYPLIHRLSRVRHVQCCLGTSTQLLFLRTISPLPLVLLAMTAGLLLLALLLLLLLLLLLFLALLL